VCAVQGGRFSRIELGHQEVCRTYGAPELFSRGFPGLTAWAKLCRTYGAPELFSRGFPGLTAWAKLCRTYGASERVGTGQQADLKKSPAMVRGRYVRQIREKMRPSAWAR